jgi:hypothetical protein
MKWAVRALCLHLHLAVGWIILLHHILPLLYLIDLLHLPPLLLLLLRAVALKKVTCNPSPLATVVMMNASIAVVKVIGVLNAQCQKADQ